MKFAAAFGLSAFLFAAAVSAQDDYPPGTFQLTPEIDLNLQSVAVQVPSQFDLQDDLVLNLPPGSRTKRASSAPSASTWAVPRPTCR